MRNFTRPWTAAHLGKVRGRVGMPIKIPASRFSSARERRRQNTKIAARTRPRPQIRAAGALQLLPRASLRQPR